VRREIVLVTSGVGKFRPWAWPRLVVDGGTIGKPGGPPAVRADRDDCMLTGDQYGQVDDRMKRRHELDVLESA